MDGLDSSHGSGYRQLHGRFMHDILDEDSADETRRGG